MRQSERFCIRSCRQKPAWIVSGKLGYLDAVDSYLDEIMPIENERISSILVEKKMLYLTRMEMLTVKCTNNKDEYVLHMEAHKK